MQTWHARIALAGCVLFLSMVSAAIASGSADGPSTPGALMVGLPGGEWVEMPLQHTDVRVEISAFVARATVEQTFLNPFDEPVEAVYTFPLGHRAAVDDFEFEIGTRVIRGEIHRRDEARRIYETARSAGPVARRAGAAHLRERVG